MTPAVSPLLRAACFEDYARIAKLQSRHLSKAMTEVEWRGLFLNNPLWPRVGATWPIGWVLEDADGAVVGSISNIPSLYRWRGTELICANGRGWVVDREYRGFALWLMDEYYSQSGVDLFINTTVADWVTSVQLEYANKVPLGNWTELAFRPIRYRPVVAKGLELRGIPLTRVLAPIAAAALWVKDTLSAPISAPPASIEIDEPRGFDRRFDDLWAEIVSDNPDMLLAERDHRTLNWHYSVPAARGDLRIFTASRAGALRAYCVLKGQPRGRGVRSMRLVDFQSVEPHIDLLSPLVHAAVARCAAEGIHMIEHLGCGIPKMQGFDRAATYRLRSNWRFFYQASDPKLADALGRPEVWDPSEFDGDASYV
jgi:hypothetical protein